MSNDGLPRPLRVLGRLSISIALMLSVMLAACGDSSGGGTGGSSGAGRGARGIPDAAAAQQKFLANVNLSAEGLARFAEFKEIGRKHEGEGDFQGCVVSYEGVLEFTGACAYNNKPRKAGERVPFEAQAEYIQSPDGWQQMGMGFYPLETP